MDAVTAFGLGALVACLGLIPVLFALLRGEWTAKGLARAFAEGIEGAKLLLPSHYKVITGLARAATERYGLHDAATNLLHAYGLNQEPGRASGLVLPGATSPAAPANHPA